LRYKHRNVTEMTKTIPIFTAIRNLKERVPIFSQLLCICRVKQAQSQMLFFPGKQFWIT